MFPKFKYFQTATVEFDQRKILENIFVHNINQIQPLHRVESPKEIS
jgi:hypothetical protein